MRNVKVIHGFAGLGIVIFTSVLFILLAIIFFVLSILVIKWGGKLAGFKVIDASTTLLAAAIVTSGIMISSAVRGG